MLKNPEMENRIFRALAAELALCADCSVVIYPQEKDAGEALMSISKARFVGVDLRVGPNLFQRVGVLRRLYRGIRFYLVALIRILHERPQVIVAHRLLALPVCVLAGLVLRKPTIYQANEVETETSSIRRGKGVLRFVESLCLRRVQSIVAVSNSTANWYRDRYRMDNVSVVRNIPDWPLFQGSPRNLHRELGIEGCILLVYSGMLIPQRSVEHICEAFMHGSAPSHIHVLFLGFGPLEDYVKQSASRCERIHFMEAVSGSMLQSVLAGADIGICNHLEDTCANHRLSLPNKIFEYTLSGLPVLADHVNLEVEEIVRSSGCGWFLSWAEPQPLGRLMNLIEKRSVDEVKARALAFARSVDGAAEQRVWAELVCRIGRELG